MVCIKGGINKVKNMVCIKRGMGGGGGGGGAGQNNSWKCFQICELSWITNIGDAFS